MSIYSDMDMYYRRSWLRYVDEEGNVFPFYVEQTQRRSGTTNSNLNSDELSDLLHCDHDALKGELKFVGALYNRRGNCIDSERSINFNDPNLIWEIPEIGYYKTSNGNWVWLTYAAVHSAKKGFSLDRVSNSFSVRNINGICGLLTQELTGQNPHRDVLLLSGSISYKGVKVGTVTDSRISLCTEAGYLVKFMKELFPSHEVEVV